MPVNQIALDIETVPVQPLTEYSKSIQEKVMEKVERRQDRNADFDYTYFASIHGDFGKIICISLGYLTGDSSIKLKSLSGDNEFDILREFNDLITNQNGIFIHYNGLSFDIPFILQRMTYHGLRPSNSRFTNLRRYSADPHFDVMMQYYNWDMQKVMPLGILAELHGLPSPKEDLSGDKVYEAYQKGEWDRIIRYCEYDTATVLNLWRKLFQYQPLVLLEKYIFSK